MTQKVNRCKDGLQQEKSTVVKSSLGKAPIIQSTRITADPAFVVGPVNRRLFGSFVEHMGRCVYTGIYEPGHPSADAEGFRTDVADLVRELGATLLRYPGGNFVSNYVWENGVGPRADRPTTLDLAWRSLETHQVGTDDFLQWCERVGVPAMLAVNLGTRGLVEAVELLQYVNAEPGSQLADRRVKNGRVDPYAVRAWCLGNEMDGPWQVGHKTAEEYARLAEETGRAMRLVDPDLELVACGSSNSGMPTFGTWERVVLERCFDVVDHISAHAYYEPLDGDYASFLASAVDMERFIAAVIATADHVAAVRRSPKRITISFDEWNVWFARRFAEKDLDIAESPRLIEDTYDVRDAVVVGSLLIALLRHTDRVAIACQAQLVNVIAPIRTEPDGPAWRQTIFHPFALTARHARGTVLQTPLTGPMITTDRFGDVDQVHSVATWDADAHALTVFAVNRSLTDASTLELDLTRFPGRLSVAEHLMLAEEDPTLTNTKDHPDRVRPRPGTSSIREGTLNSQLPPVSWHCIRVNEGGTTPLNPPKSRCSPKGTSHDHTIHRRRRSRTQPPPLPVRHPRPRGRGHHGWPDRLRAGVVQRPRSGGPDPAGDGGAGGYDGPKVDLKFWNGFTGGDGPIMKQLVTQFNGEHPNIAVAMNTLQWADYYATLPTAVTAGKGPEIAIMHVDSVATNAARKVIQPLDDVATALGLSEADFAPVPWKAGVYQERRYAIPLDVHPLGFYYNKTVMEKAGLDPEAPPTTAEEYGTALDTLKSKGIEGHWATPFPFTGSMTVQSLVWQFGGDLFAPDASAVTWADEPAVQAMTWYVDLVKNGNSPAKIAQDADTIALQNGKTAFNWNGIWNINTLREKKSLQWGVAALPNIGGTPAAWAGSHQFVLPTLKTPDDNKSRAARVFLNWISQQSVEWAKAGQVPVRNDVRESAEFKALPEQSALAAQIDVLHFPPTVPGISDAFLQWEKALNDAVLGTKDPKTALSDAAGRATKILEDNKRKYG